MFSPHRGDVLHGLPDSYSVWVACLFHLSVWERAGEKAADWPLTCPPPLPQVLGAAGTFGFGAVWDQRRKKWASCWLWCLHQKQAIAAAWSGDRHGAGLRCLQRLNTIPQPSHGAPLPTMSGWSFAVPLLVAGPLAQCEHFSRPWGLPPPSSAGYLSCWDHLLCHSCMQACRMHFEWQYQAWDTDE